MNTRLVIGLALALASSSCSRADVPAGNRPATMDAGNGAAILPNGRIVRPDGRVVRLGNLPLGIAVSVDGKRVVVTNCGAGKQSIMMLVRSARGQTFVQEAPVKTVFNGIALSRDGQKAWVCGGGANNVQTFRLRGRALIPGKAIEVSGYPTSCVLSPDGGRLYVTCNLGRAVRIVDTAKSSVVGEIEAGLMPYGIALTPDGRKAYVTNWADGTVSVLDVVAGKPLATLKAGSLPCGVVVSRDGSRVFVANANTDSLTVIDARRDSVVRTVDLRPYPNAPYGTSPNGVAVTPDGRALYVTCAGLNAVAKLTLPDLKVQGWIPTAWYPTGITVGRDGRLLVVSSKGFGSGPNKDGGHISTMMRGTLQVIDPKDLTPAIVSRGARLVERSNGLANRGPEKARMAGIPTEIKHVVFIVRENRSYDQVLGDLGYANGDPSLTIFGERVTPNLHELARRFAIADNMYGDGEVSVQGHQWTLGANCPDYVEKTWHALYSRRGRLMDAIPGPWSYPAIGYMMDQCVRSGVSCRMYGDFVRRQRGGRPAAGLEGKVCPTFTGWNLSVPDQKRADAWLAEFRQGIFPQFSYIWLPNDHTAGAAGGMPTPRAMVADNDLATGRIIDAISHSPEWRDTVIFLTEDDTQDGRDHVDAHRNILLIMSPWVKPHSVTSHHYSIASVYTTIEGLLGIAPMSQYDDLADPIRGIWQAAPDAQPYTALPNRVPLDERNGSRTTLARESARLDLAEPDANTGPLLESILWRAMKGDSASAGRTR